MRARERARESKRMRGGGTGEEERVSLPEGSAAAGFQAEGSKSVRLPLGREARFSRGGGGGNALDARRPAVGSDLRRYVQTLGTEL